MMRKLILLTVAGFTAVLFVACQKQPRATFDPRSASEFFPLPPKAVWTYKVDSKSQHTTYVVTDTVVGQKYVPALNVTGMVVEEYYNLDRGGVRPIVYTSHNGYLDRLSGLAYQKQDIEAPAWGRSEEGEFMPKLLAPNLDWSSKIYPFGHISGAFDISQTHHTYFEPEAIVVPAGSFLGCIRIDSDARYEGGTYAQKGNKNLKLTYRDWYAPNVGLIKTVVLEGGPGGSEMEHVELLRYSIPSAAGSASGAADNPGAPSVGNSAADAPQSAKSPAVAAKTN